MKLIHEKEKEWQTAGHLITLFDAMIHWYGVLRNIATTRFNLG
jgi:hypothetical protein